MQESQVVTWEEYFSDWSDEKLQQEALCLHDLIYNAECYGSKDLMFYDGALGELERRGYRILTTLAFQKEDRDEAD